MLRFLGFMLLCGIAFYVYMKGQEAVLPTLKATKEVRQKEQYKSPDPVVNAVVAQKYPVPTQIDSIMVDKSEGKMSVFYRNKLLKIYDVGIGQVPKGHKEVEGDLKTPEGLYHIDGKNPNSDFHKNLGISYPNEKDKNHAKTLGKSAGGAIKIHGIGEGYPPNKRFGFTWGCIAVTNTEIDELYAATPVGIPIHIFP
jgi:murein L,D-transpeptidase YafK